MSTSTLASTVEVDADLAMAGIALGEARRAHARCPSAENARLVDRAAAAVDRLLDRKLALRPAAVERRP